MLRWGWKGSIWPVDLEYKNGKLQSRKNRLDCVLMVCLLPVWLLAGYLTSLSLSFFICKTELIIPPSWIVVRKRNPCQKQRAVSDGSSHHCFPKKGVRPKEVCWLLSGPQPQPLYPLPRLCSQSKTSKQVGASGLGMGVQIGLLGWGLQTKAEIRNQWWGGIKKWNCLLEGEPLVVQARTLT